MTNYRRHHITVKQKLTILPLLGLIEDDEVSTRFNKSAGRMSNQKNKHFEILRIKVCSIMIFRQNKRSHAIPNIIKKLVNNLIMDSNIGHQFVKRVNNINENVESINNKVSRHRGHKTVNTLNK